MVLQLGFNWKGKRDFGLFEKGTKREIINFVKKETSKNWNIIDIGIAEKKDNRIKYYDLNDINIERNDSIGEFLNRPIFILKSLRCNR